MVSPSKENRNWAKKTDAWDQTKPNYEQSKTEWGECKRIESEVPQRINTPEITQQINPLIEPVYSVKKYGTLRKHELSMIKMKETSTTPAMNLRDRMVYFVTVTGLLKNVYFILYY